MESLVTAPVLCRCDAVGLLKSAGKIALILKADHQRDIGQAQPAVFDELTGAFEASIHDRLLDGYACFFAEDSAEISGGEAGCENVCDAVSSLLFGIPINAYFALDIRALKTLTDAVGGVEAAATDEALSRCGCSCRNNLSFRQRAYRKASRF